MGAGEPADPVDWSLAERVAHRVAGREPLADSYHGEALVADFAAVTEQAAELVAGFTGLRLPVAPRHGIVLDRQQWASRNLSSFRRLLAPLTARLGEQMARSPFVGFNRRVAALETGVLLGFFSQRVLGQYDLFGGDGGDGDRAGEGIVYYVGPNVLGIEKRFAFRPRDFRLWIALHEVTHLVQFTAVPWLRDHLLSLVDASLGLLDPDPRRLANALRHVVDEVRAGRNPLGEGGLVTLFASPEQREVLARVQALMALLEGHGNYVMDRLGAQHVAGQARMSELLRKRREALGWAGRVQRIVGIELKMRQYAVGEQFFTAVEAQAGPESLAALWRGPECLPDLEELRKPDRWLSRIGAVV